MKRGDVYYALLDPTIGHEQSGRRPVIVIQSDTLNRVIKTVLVIPLTSNVRRAHLPSCHLVKSGDGGLGSDSVALCHQLRVLDASRLGRRLGSLSDAAVEAIDEKLLFTLDLP